MKRRSHRHSGHTLAYVVAKTANHQEWSGKTFEGTGRGGVIEIKWGERETDEEEEKTA